MSSRTLCLTAFVLLAACNRETTQTTATATTTGTTATTGTQSTTVAGDPKDLSKTKIDTVLKIPPTVVPQCYSGSVLGGNGAVAEAKTEFGPKDPIHFSMWLNEAPAGLQVSVKVFDEKEKEVSTTPMSGQGLKIATFTVPRPKPGKYKLEGYWGGNVVCAKSIEVK
ncbi:MAG TPA: hypothetical protein VEU30_16110 [Thermoanaerobaculia bacterium]|nr:hypothetical protein [Thermoanaerobaculia bacterium]